MAMTWWMWMVLGIILLACELVTPGGFFLLFFGLGGVIVGVLASLGIAGPDWMQWFLFTVVSIAMIVFLRKHLLFMRGSRNEDADADSFVGATAILLEEINVNATGKAEMRGTSWTARNIDTRVLNRGQRCRVERVEGLTLHVKADH